MFLNKKSLRILTPFIIGIFIYAGVLADTKNNTAPSNQNNTPSPLALKYAINAYEWALQHNQVSNPDILTLVDFQKPSYEKRLWVINLKKDQVLMHTYVAQGRGSGNVYATRFSNNPGSHASSLGIFTTADVYDGAHGRSLRVNGLEKGINNNALNREVVIHPAPYVTSEFIKANGFAGRSWGCFAVSPQLAEQLITTVKNGTVLFAYAETEKYDERVNHALSANGRVLYSSIMNGGEENFIQRFFAWL